MRAFMVLWVVFIVFAPEISALVSSQFGVVHPEYFRYHYVPRYDA